MSLNQLPLGDNAVRFDSCWMPVAGAAVLFDALLAAVPWGIHHIRVLGRDVPSPRLSCWIGDPGAAYTYSGTRFTPHPWPSVLLPVRARLREELGIDFNSVLANRYRDGRDGMGWHRDAEADLGPEPVIASLSLGAVRRFAFRDRRDPSRRLALDLPSGSLLVMAGATQRHYLHALPKTARPVGERINLTFRRIVAMSPAS